MGAGREAIRRLQEILEGTDVDQARLHHLSTAVGEAMMNAVEHAHGYVEGADEPDLDAKLRGEQTPRGRGVFLVRSLVDRVPETGDDEQHTLMLELGDRA